MRRRSCFLVSLFLLFKFLPKDLINTVLSAYFVFLVRARHAATSCLGHTTDVLTPPRALCVASRLFPDQGVLAIAACLAPFVAAVLPRTLARRTVRCAALPTGAVWALHDMDTD